MDEEYQPGLGLSDLRVVFQQYIEAENKKDEEAAKRRDLMVSGAKVGKSAYDYWAMDQMGKYKDLLSEKIVGANGISRNVYETSDIYKDKSALGIGWDKDRWRPTFEKGRMFTPGEERVQFTDDYLDISKQRASKLKPEIPIDIDTSEWEMIDTELTDPDTFFIDDVPAGTDDIGALGVPTEDIPDLYEMYTDGTITASSAPGPMTANVGMNDAWMTDSSGAELISSTDDELIDIAMSGFKSPVAEGGAMTASAGMSDSYTAAGDILGSTDEVISATGEASKYSKLAGGVGKGLGVLGTAYGAYNLATNWDDMSDAEKAQGALQTIGGTMALTGVGAPIGLALSAAGTIWDWLD